MNERDLTGLFQLLLDGVGQCQDGDELPVDEIDCESRLAGCRAQTFEDVGLLTRNDGIVLSLADGSEFQITVVRSR